MLHSPHWVAVVVTSWWFLLPGTLAIRETGELNLETPLDPIALYGVSPGQQDQAEFVTKFDSPEPPAAVHPPTLEGPTPSQAAIQEPQHVAATEPGWPLAVAAHVAEIERSVEHDLPRIAENAEHALLSELGFVEPCKDTDLDGRHIGCFTGCSCYFHQDCYPLRNSAGQNLGICSLRISVLTVLSLGLLCVIGSCVVGSRLALQHQEYIQEVAWLEKKSAEYALGKAEINQDAPVQVDHGWESGTD